MFGVYSSSATHCLSRLCSGVRPRPSLDPNHEVPLQPIPVSDDRFFSPSVTAEDILDDVDTFFPRWRGHSPTAPAPLRWLVSVQSKLPYFLISRRIRLHGPMCILQSIASGIRLSPTNPSCRIPSTGLTWTRRFWRCLLDHWTLLCRSCLSIQRSVPAPRFIPDLEPSRTCPTSACSTFIRSWDMLRLDSALRRCFISTCFLGAWNALRLGFLATSSLGYPVKSAITGRPMHGNS